MDRRVKSAVAVLTAMNLFNYMDRLVLPAVLPDVEKALSLSHGQAGLLGSAFIVVYFVTSPFFGFLGDRTSRRGLIAIGVSVWSLASGASGLARGFGSLLAARASVGIGEAAYATISPSLISDYFPPERRGRVMSLFYTATPIGVALGYLLGGYIGHKWGWRWAFLVTGLPGLALAALALGLYEPPRGSHDTGPREAPPLGDAIRLLARNRVYVWTVLGYTASTFAVGGLSFWMPTYLHDVRGYALDKANLLVGGCTVVAGLAGTLGGGWLGEVLRHRVKGSYLFVSGLSALATCPLAMAVFYVPKALMVPFLFAALLCLFMPTAPVNTVLVNSVPAGIRATAMAACIFVIHLLGDAISPSLIGLTADATSLRAAVLLVPLTIGVGGLMWLYALRAGSASQPVAAADGRLTRR